MIWIIGGTGEALKIADLALAYKHDVLVTTTTDYGSSLAAREGVIIKQQYLDENQMQELIANYKIRNAIDASHPFAEEVSRNAIAACEKAGISLVRFERPSIDVPRANYYEHYEDMITHLHHEHGKIFLTIGANNAYRFISLGKERIVARILPLVDSINKCIKAGFDAHQLIAMKGRVNKETNKALMEEYRIRHLVSKETGKDGGLLEKVMAAKEMNINIHILKRPELDYPCVISHLDDIEHLLKEF